MDEGSRMKKAGKKSITRRNHKTAISRLQISEHRGDTQHNRIRHASNGINIPEHVETCVMPQSYRSIQSYRSLGREVKWKMYLEDEATEGPDILEWILTKNKQWKKSSDEVPKCLSAVHKLISDRFDVRAHDTDATEIDESL